MTPPSATISFSCKDEQTPLAETTSVNTDMDPVTNIVADSVEELRALLSSPSSGNHDHLPDKFEDGILEVYGPPSKCPRRSTATLEEMMASTMPLEPTPIAIPTMCSPDSIPAVPTYAAASTLDAPAALVHAGRMNDGSFGDHLDNPGSEENVCQITQDKDLNPPFSDDIAHQITRIAEDSASDELFDRIDGHLGQDGLLMFQIRWKTDEVSTLLFSTVKHNFT